MGTLIRFLQIFWTILLYRLDDVISCNPNPSNSSKITRKIQLRVRPRTARGVRLRLALESLGPIFIKFGQVLSTRRDLIPLDISNELILLQNQVTPFSSREAASCIEEAFKTELKELFAHFDTSPVAAASIAQVHFAKMHDGREVAIKVLRPGILKIIERDLAVLRILAHFMEKIAPNSKHLKPRKVIDEFDKYLHDELDLIREASNCSQLRRNFISSTNRANTPLVPRVIWERTSKNVFTMERMYGFSVGHTELLQKSGIDSTSLAQSGVEIFFTQVFSDGFFHADMHPGNIYVSNQPKTLGQYIFLDFGIVGSLSEFDKNYLAQNFLAFLRRDYQRVAQLHIESGWVPPETREEEFEGAIRTVCESYFDGPISEISLGQILLRLFQTSRRFSVEIQPQLVLLQKTLVNVEGLGKQLDPQLNLWKVAEPYLEKWLREYVGWSSFCKNLAREMSCWSKLLPTLPRLLHKKLSYPRIQPISPSEVVNSRKIQKHDYKVTFVIIGSLVICLTTYLWH